MRTGFICTICALFILSALMPGVARAELVGWWKLDEQSGTIAHDSSGRGNDGALLGGAVWAAGQIGGEVVAASSASYTLSDLGSTSQNWLGRSQYADPYFNGSLDDFRIYNRALSEAEIRYLAGDR